MRNLILGALITATLLLGNACSSQSGPGSASYQDSVQQALKQADLTDVSVSEDRDKNTITLTGTLHSEDAKRRAEDVAKSAAGTRVVADEIMVAPVGAESEAKDIASNQDDAIEKNYKAALIAQHLDKQHIRFDVKNGVMTLHGSVKSTPQRDRAEQLAQAVPNVQQVVNNLEVRR